MMQGELIVVLAFFGLSNKHVLREYRRLSGRRQPQ